MKIKADIGMRLPCFSLLIIIVLSIASCSSVVEEKYPDGTIKSEVTMENGRKNGPAKYYYPVGKVELSMNYQDDKLEGLYEKFTVKGIRTEMTMYSNGMKNGKSEVFTEDGKILISALFINDTIHGPYKEYHPNGQIKVSGAYNHGLYHGDWEYYDATGIRVGYAEFENGTGKQFALHYGSKRIKTEVNFVNNQKNGAEIWYNQNGNIDKKIMYSQGKIISTE
ncbi:MAG: toxin-antitoxin system YwqK family antitoxin [Bacteroidales bacterium]|nr:hypothetical protein [Bacteroidales bacterium]